MLVSAISSVTQSCPTLCDPKDCSTPDFPVHHQLWELTQTHVRQVGDVVPPSRLQSFPASGSFPMSSRFTSGGQSIRASAALYFRGSFLLMLDLVLSSLREGSHWLNAVCCSNFHSPSHPTDIPEMLLKGTFFYFGGKAILKHKLGEGKLRYKASGYLDRRGVYFPLLAARTCVRPEEGASLTSNPAPRSLLLPASCLCGRYPRLLATFVSLSTLGRNHCPRTLSSVYSSGLCCWFFIGFSQGKKVTTNTEWQVLFICLFDFVLTQS